jgi:hypothetical protein
MPPPVSHPPDLLRYSHPEWVDTLSRGAGVAYWGLILGALAAAAGELFPHHLPAIQPYRLAAVAGGLLLLRGVWLLTAHDAGGAAPKNSPLRWGLRLALTAAVSGGMLKAAVAVGVAGSYATTFSAAALVASAADVLGRFAFLRHLRALALRVPDPKLAKQFGPFVPAYGVALVAAAAVEALRTLPVVRHLGIASAVAVAVVTVLLLRHVARLGRALVIQTDYARGTWAKANGGGRVGAPPGTQSRTAAA